MRQDLVIHRRPGDERHNPHRAGAVRAHQRVDLEELPPHVDSTSEWVTFHPLATASSGDPLPGTTASRAHFLVTPMPRPDVLEKLVSLCKRRGFIFQSSEIYGGTGSVWDYGPLGVELKKNVKDAWWHSMVRSRDDVEGWTQPS